MIFAGVSAMFSRKEGKAMRGRNLSALRGGEDGATPAPFSCWLGSPIHTLGCSPAPTSLPRNAQNPVRPKGGHPFLSLCLFPQMRNTSEREQSG